MMKKILMILLLTSFSWSFGQNLTLSQLFELRKASLEDTEMLLNQRGWSFFKGAEQTEKSLGNAFFVYKDSNNMNSGESFLGKLYSYDGTSRINLQFGKKDKYFEYLNSIKNLKIPIIYSGMHRGNLIKIYQGKTTTIILKTSVGKNKLGEITPQWFLSLYENNDFDTSGFKNELNN